MAKLDREIAAFERLRNELERAHAGKFAFVQGTDLIGTVDTFETAAGEGLRRFPDAEFLVREIGSAPPKLSAPL